MPTGIILPNPAGGPFDFWTAPKQIGADFDAPSLNRSCGEKCVGYDVCFITNRAPLGPYDWRKEGPVATLHSAWSGIQLDVFTDQDALQIYSCNNQNGGTNVYPFIGMYTNTNKLTINRKRSIEAQSGYSWP